MIFGISGVLLVLAASTFLFYKAAGTLALNRLNIISYSYYMFILQVFIGVALIFLGFDEHYTLNYLIHRDESIAMTVNISAITAIALPAVIVLANKILKFNPRKEFSAFLVREAEKEKGKYIFKIIVIIACIQLILLVGQLIKTGYVPIIKMFIHDSSFDFNLERQINKNDIAIISPYVKNIILMYGIPIIGYITFAYAMMERKVKWILLAVVYFISGIIVKTYEFAKSPIIFYLFVYFLIFLYVKHDIIKNYMVISFGAIMAGVIVLMYKLIGYSGAFLDIYNGILGRTFFSQVGALAYHFDLFPETFDYLHGRSLASTLLPLIGEEPDAHLRSAKLVMDFYGSDRVYEGTAGVLNTCFLGEAYANWGIFGVIFSIIYVGVFLTLMFMLIMRIKKTPVTVAMLAIMTQTLGNVIHGGFTDFIYSFSIWITILGCLFLIYIDDIINWMISKFKKSSNNN